MKDKHTPGNNDTDRATDIGNETGKHEKLEWMRRYLDLADIAIQQEPPEEGAA